MRDIHRIELFLKRRGAITDEIEPALVLIDTDQRLDVPIAARQRRHAAPGKMVEMTVAGPLRPPDQAAVLHRVECRRQVDPALRARSLGNQHAGRARRRIDLQQIEHGLIPRFARDVERVAVCRPIDAGKVDIGVRPHINLHLTAAIGLHHIKIDKRIRRARRRVALIIDLRAVRSDRGSRHHLHGADVGALHGDVFFVRRPPIAGAAIHFLLRDEFGGAPADGIARALSDGLRLAGGDRFDDQLIVTDIAQISALRADQRIERAALHVRQPSDGAGGVGEVELTVDRHQQMLAVGRPIIGNDPLLAADTLPLALHLFRFGKRRARADLLGIDQHALRARRRVDRPEIVTIGLVRPRLEQGHHRSIGR